MSNVPGANERTPPKVSSSAEWAAKKEQAPTQPVPTTLLTCPSGATVEVCRPDLIVWLASGALPQVYVDLIIGVDGELDPQQKKEAAARVDAELQSDPRKLRQSLNFMRDAVLAAVVRPRIKLGATGPDEIEPSLIPDEDFHFIFQHVIAGSPGVPVETEGGQTSVDGLSNFRDESLLRPTGDDVRPLENRDESKASRKGRGSKHGPRSSRRTVAKKK
jgi:hypothetical protein